MSHSVKKITGRRAERASARTVARPPRNVRPALRVAAEVHDDEFMLKIPFDAAPWFRQASDAEIRALAAIGWGGNLEADAVGEFACKYDAAVGTLFDYLGIRRRGGKDAGFECHVVAADARAWCVRHRPHLFPGDDA